MTKTFGTRAISQQLTPISPNSKKEIRIGPNNIDDWDKLKQIKYKLGLNQYDTLIAHAAPDDKKKEVDESRLINRYYTKVSQKASTIDRKRQKKFGAEYLLTSNALTNEDNDLLLKYAGITLCTNQQLSKSGSRKSIHVSNSKSRLKAD